LIDSHELHRRHLLDVGKRQLCGFIQLPLDLDRELVGINVQRHVAQMITHENASFGVMTFSLNTSNGVSSCWRAAREPDHQTLLRIFDDGSLAVFERHCHRIRREPSNRKPADHAASREQGCPTRRTVPRFIIVSFCGEV
jgi:hypothetical protein